MASNNFYYKLYLYERYKNTHEREKMSLEMDSDELKKLIQKQLEETELINNMIIYSQRTAFVYGDEESEKKRISIEEFLVDLLNEKGPITRSTMASLTNIPRTTLYDILAKLIMQGKVEKKPIRTKKRGRPKILFCAKD